MIRIHAVIVFSLGTVLLVTLPFGSFGQTKEHRPPPANDQNDVTKQTPDHTVWQQGTVRTQANTIDAQLPASSPTPSLENISLEAATKHDVHFTQLLKALAIYNEGNSRLSRAISIPLAAEAPFVACRRSTLFLS